MEDNSILETLEKCMKRGRDDLQFHQDRVFVKDMLIKDGFVNIKNVYKVLMSIVDDNQSLCLTKDELKTLLEEQFDCILEE